MPGSGPYPRPARTAAAPSDDKTTLGAMYTSVPIANRCASNSYTKSVRHSLLRPAAPSNSLDYHMKNTRPSKRSGGCFLLLFMVTFFHLSMQLCTPYKTA